MLAPTYTIAGAPYNDVGSALNALATGGAKTKYFNANSTGVDSTATGIDAVAIGTAAVAANKNDIALGANSSHLPQGGSLDPTVFQTKYCVPKSSNGEVNKFSFPNWTAPLFPIEIGAFPCFRPEGPFLSAQGEALGLTSRAKYRP